MKYKVLLFLAIIPCWLGALPPFRDIRQIIDNQSSQTLRITVTQKGGGLCKKEKSWMVEPKKKKRIWVRSICDPISMYISSSPTDKPMQVNIISSLPGVWPKMRESNRPEFPLFAGHWANDPREESYYNQWDIIVRGKDAPLKIEATVKRYLFY